MKIQIYFNKLFIKVDYIYDKNNFIEFILF